MRGRCKGLELMLRKGAVPKSDSCMGPNTRNVAIPMLRMPSRRCAARDPGLNVDMRDKLQLTP